MVTDMSDELVAEGFARELVRRLQMMRRAANFEISDHIVVSYHGSPVLQDVFTGYDDYIRQETLSARAAATRCRKRGCPSNRSNWTATKSSSA